MGVAGAQRPDEAGEGAPEQGGGAVQVAVVALEDRQIVDGHGDVGVVAAEHAFLDGERPRVQRPGASGRVAALLDGRQARQVEADLQAPRAQHAREHRQRPPVERGGLAQAAPRLDDGGQRRDVGGDRRVGRPDQRRAQADGPARVRLGARVVAARVLDAAQVVGQRRVRVTIAARHQGQRAAIEGERLGIPPLRLAQDAEVVEHAGDVAIARAETAADLREGGPVAAIGGRVRAQRPIDARQRGAGADREPRDVRIARAHVRAAGEDAQRLPLAAGRLAQAIARLQHQPELDQRVRDVRVPGTLDRLIAGDREAAGALGGGEAPVGAQRDRPLVGPDGRNQRVVVAAPRRHDVGGWLPPGGHCTVSHRDVAAHAPVRFRRSTLLRARGDPDVRARLRARGAQVPARRFRRQRQLRPPARSLPDVGRRHVDRCAGERGAEPGAGRGAGDDAGRSPAGRGIGGAARPGGRAVAVRAHAFRRRLAGARRLGAGDGSGAGAPLGTARELPARRVHAFARPPGGGVSRMGGQRRVHGAARAADAGARHRRRRRQRRADRARARGSRLASDRRAGSRGARRRGARRRRRRLARRGGPPAGGRARGGAGRGRAGGQAGRIGARDGDGGAARRRRQRAGHGARRGAAARGRRDAPRRREARGAARRAAGGGRRAPRAGRRGAVAPAARSTGAVAPAGGRRGARGGRHRHRGGAVSRPVRRRGPGVVRGHHRAAGVVAGARAAGRVGPAARRGGDRGTVPRSVHAQDPTPRRPLLPEPPRVRHGRARAPGSQAARRCPRWRATSCARC